jgi:hypothetical protein
LPLPSFVTSAATVDEGSPDVDRPIAACNVWRDLDG